VVVLGGYGKILKGPIIATAKDMFVNLHGGRLPKYRGSSPMNWSLINGEKEFGLSIIKVDTGVDTGDLLLERVFPIDPSHSIADLHHRANHEFPLMLVEVLRGLRAGSLAPRKQPPGGSYWPLRFSEDGFILWDTLTAEQVHNRIRALTEPYPCAFSYYEGRKVRLLVSSLPEEDFFGEPGRIYRVSPKKGVLVCAADKCLWLSRAVFEDGKELAASAERYAKLATVRGSILSSLESGSFR
jgi:methionyl-tRNA formyltransferase